MTKTPAKLPTLRTVATAADVADLAVVQAFARGALNPGRAYAGREADADGWDVLSMEGPHRSTWHLTGYRLAGQTNTRAVYVFRFAVNGTSATKYAAAVLDVTRDPARVVTVHAYDYQPAAETTRTGAEEKAAALLFELEAADLGVTLAPSRVYGFRRPSSFLPGEDPATLLQIVEHTAGRWIGTPARYNAESLADLGSGAALAIDAGAGWRLSQEDTAALAAHARAVIAGRLEELRAELRAERISWGELAELQGLAPHIDGGDVELLEAAGVPEHADDVDDLDDAPAAPAVPAVDQLRAGTVAGPAAVLFGE